MALSHLKLYWHVCEKTEACNGCAVVSNRPSKWEPCCRISLIFWC